MATPSSETVGSILLRNLQQVIVGKEEVLRQVVTALLAGGHLLIEDVPGLGKTILARALARSLDADLKRVQFTPDLLPTDLTGVAVFHPGNQTFEFRRGPVFCNLLLADELNRATPRTQSALLEAMEERQVTADGATHPLPNPFFVMATQNPLEQQGVYPLPEAQLDRFLMKIGVGYPDAGEEGRMIEAQKTAHPIEDLKSVAAIGEIVEAQRKVREMHVEPSVRDYIVRVVAATRKHRDLLLGGSPRASLSLYRAAQALTLLDGEPFVRPDAVKRLFKPSLRHRVILHPPARLSGKTPDEVLDEVLRSEAAPVRAHE